MCDDCAVPAGLTRRELVLGAGAGAMALALGAAPASAAGTSGVEVAPGLVIRPRSDWDRGKKAKWAIPTEDVKFLLVHHTAGALSYPQAKVPEILRRVYAFHAGPKKGWPDVCYNFFVDRYGGVWEGRTGSLDGAVMADATGGSQGFAQLVCLLGNFTNAMPTPAARLALTRTLAWMADRHGIDTTPGATTQFVSRGSNRWKAGVTVTARTISGHRDMSQTSCPGNTFYPYVHNQLQGLVTAARTA